MVLTIAVAWSGLLKLDLAKLRSTKLVGLDEGTESVGTVGI